MLLKPRYYPILVTKIYQCGSQEIILGNQFYYFGFKIILFMIFNNQMQFVVSTLLKALYYLALRWLLYLLSVAVILTDFGTSWGCATFPHIVLPRISENKLLNRKYRLYFVIIIQNHS